MRTSETSDTYSAYSRLRIENLRKSINEIETCCFINPQDPMLLDLKRGFLLKIAELESDMRKQHDRTEDFRSVAPLKINLALRERSVLSK